MRLYQYHNPVLSFLLFCLAQMAIPGGWRAAGGGACGCAVDILDRQQARPPGPHVTTPRHFQPGREVEHNVGGTDHILDARIDFSKMPLHVRFLAGLRVLAGLVVACF